MTTWLTVQVHHARLVVKFEYARRELAGAAARRSAGQETLNAAQVHHALLRDGQEVAVKVQYAGLESAVAADLATFKGLAAVAGLAFPAFKLGWVRRSNCCSNSFDLSRLTPTQSWLIAGSLPAAATRQVDERKW